MTNMVSMAFLAHQLPQLPGQREGKRAESSHDPKPLGPQMGVEHAGDKGEQRGGGSDTDSTVDRLRCSFEAVRHDTGEETHAGKMKQRKSDTVQWLHHRKRHHIGCLAPSLPSATCQPGLR